MKKYLNPNTTVLNVTTIVCTIGASVGGGASQGGGRAPQRGENIGKLYI